MGAGVGIHRTDWTRLRGGRAVSLAYAYASKSAAALPPVTDRQLPALAFDCIYAPNAAPSAAVDLGSVAYLFRYSLALTAWKHSTI